MSPDTLQNQMQAGRFLGDQVQDDSRHTSQKKAKRDHPGFRELMALLEVQGYRCALTGKELSPEDAELDHKIPISRGGTNQLSNLQWVDKSINRAKTSMTNEEFIAMCKRVASYPPMS